MDILANIKETRTTEHLDNIRYVSETRTVNLTALKSKINSFLESDNQHPNSTRVPTFGFEKKIKAFRSRIQKMGLKNSKYQSEHCFCDTETQRIKCRCPWVQHASNFCSWAHRAQKEGHYCDFYLQTDKKTFRAHSIIIGCHSGLFQRVAQSNLARCGRVVLKVDNIRPELLGQLLDYAYTGKIDVNKTNVAEISKAAVDFEMVGILRICLDFTSKMDDEQALIILLHSEGIPKSNLIFRRAFDYTLFNFRSVYPNQLFKQLSYIMIFNILRNDDLIVCSELETLDALLRWTHNNFVDRKVHFSELIGLVRFCQMTMDELIYASSISDLLPKYCHRLLIHANWLVTLRHLGYRDPLQLEAGKPRNCLYYQEKTKESDHAGGYDGEEMDPKP